MSELAKLDEQLTEKIEHLESMRAKVRELRREMEEASCASSLPSLNHHHTSKRGVGKPPTGSVSMKRAAVDALREEGPMELDDLAIAVQHRGAKSTADDFKAVLYQSLYKARKAKRPEITYNTKTKKYEAT